VPLAAATRRHWRSPPPDADDQPPELPDGFVPAGLSAKDIREACRALKGQMLRQEVYALDGSAQEPHPYKVTEVCRTFAQ